MMLLCASFAILWIVFRGLPLASKVCWGAEESVNCCSCASSFLFYSSACLAAFSSLILSTSSWFCRLFSSWRCFSSSRCLSCSAFHFSRSASIFCFRTASSSLRCLSFSSFFRSASSCFRLDSSSAALLLACCSYSCCLRFASCSSRFMAILFAAICLSSR